MGETYTQTFERAIDHIAAQTKCGKLLLESRMLLVESAVSAYLLAHAEYADIAKKEALDLGNEPPFNPPNGALLERANYWLFYECFQNKDSHKSRHEEYPILSEYQIARRQSGVHQRKGSIQTGEAPFKAAFDKAADGRDYAIPKRRKRSIYEDLLRDEQAMIRNKERRRKYEAFIKPSKVRVYKLSEMEAV